MAIYSDADSFLSEFGEEAVYTPGSGSPAYISVIFTQTAEEEIVGEDNYVMSKLEAHVKTSAVPGVAINDLISIRGSGYYVVGIFPDHDGWTTLKLSESQA